MGFPEKEHKIDMFANRAYEHQALSMKDHATSSSTLIWGSAFSYVYDL